MYLFSVNGCILESSWKSTKWRHFSLSFQAVKNAPTHYLQNWSFFICITKHTWMDQWLCPCNIPSLKFPGIFKSRPQTWGIIAQLPREDPKAFFTISDLSVWVQTPPLPSYRVRNALFSIHVGVLLWSDTTGEQEKGEWLLMNYLWTNAIDQVGNDGVFAAVGNQYQKAQLGCYGGEQRRRHRCSMVPAYK